MSYPNWICQRRRFLPHEDEAIAGDRAHVLYTQPFMSCNRLKVLFIREIKYERITVMRAIQRAFKLPKWWLE